MPSDVVKIRVRSGASEAEIEADLAHIREAIDLIPEVVKKLPDGSQQHRGERAAENLLEQKLAPETRPFQSEPPSVTLERKDSLTDVIGKFFADSWGRERRKLSDVRDALQSYGLNYPKQSVAVALLRLAKTTRIRRFKAEDGEYVYTTSTAAVSPAHPPQQSLPSDQEQNTNL